MGCRQSRARPHPLFGLTRAERAYFDAAGSPMRARATTYGSIAVDVADAGDDEEEEEEGDRARDAAGARSSGWLGTSARRRGATVAAAACLAMCGVGALALAIAPPEIRAGVASSLGLRIPESPKPGFVEANRHESTSFLAPLGSNDANDANEDEDASHGPLRAPSSSSSFEPRRNGYLVGLTTSAGFGDQFKRLSTCASMARSWTGRSCCGRCGRRRTTTSTADASRPSGRFGSPITSWCTTGTRRTCRTGW